MIRFGLQLPSFTFPGLPDDHMFDRVADIATAAEDAGFDSFFVMDHFQQIGMIGPPEEPMLEAYTLLGGVAARTSRIKLGTLVTGVAYRNPALLAKMVTTLDVVSSGRAILGIGAAWNDKEATEYGYDWPPTGERMARLEDALHFGDGSWTMERRNGGLSELLDGDVDDCAVALHVDAAAAPALLSRGLPQPEALQAFGCPRRRRPRCHVARRACGCPGSLGTCQRHPACRSVSVAVLIGRSVRCAYSVRDPPHERKRHNHQTEVRRRERTPERDSREVALRGVRYSELRAPCSRAAR